jgi:hypothetical protein
MRNAAFALVLGLGTAESAAQPANWKFQCPEVTAKIEAIIPESAPNFRANPRDFVPPGHPAVFLGAQITLEIGTINCLYALDGRSGTTFYVIGSGLPRECLTAKAFRPPWRRNTSADFVCDGTAQACAAPC